jgi:very-short-patch-repair endonuclease/DNA-directed RNA polymerase subunit RPC12/RpoP
MFSEHLKSKFWSDKNEKKPNEVKLNSHKKFWFDCECGHQFESSLLNINQANNWCPYCSNPPKKLCDNENCKDCFVKSFASHEKSKYWSNDNELKPRQVFNCADRKTFIFNCYCGHKINMNLKQISLKEHWRSYCSHQKLCENTKCEMCFNNSFASIERSKQLNDKIINPRNLFKSTNKKFKFDCETCNKDFETQLSSVSKGIWCPYCVNKTELILFNSLKEFYITLERQFKVEWCKNKKHLPFDFIIEERKIIIELDGKQHFEQVGKWLSPEETMTNDLYKMKCANDNGFSVIRILQKDVYKNKYDWLSELISNIEKITYENRVQNIYMCKNNEYKNFENV